MQVPRVTEQEYIATMMKVWAVFLIIFQGNYDFKSLQFSSSVCVIGELKIQANDYHTSKSSYTSSNIIHAI